MIQNIKAVAFDLDGTLYPNYRLNIRLIPFFFKQWRLLTAFGKTRGIIRRRQKQFPAIFEQEFYDYQAQITANLLKKPPEIIKEKIDSLIYRGWAPFFNKIKMFPHVTGVLDELKAAGFKLGLLSDFPPHTKLENLGIPHYWDIVHCSENSGALKPSGRPFKKLSEALGCLPEQILYVGNSRPYDIEGAKQAGMKTALKTSRLRAFFSLKTRNVADFQFYDYRQLRNFVLN